MATSEDLEQAGSRIIAWYDSTRPRFIDLVGDYAGQELFLIEGDGLLREAFGDERLDFEGEQPTVLEKHLLIKRNRWVPDTSCSLHC